MSGYEFGYRLYKMFGLLEGYRMCEEYLEIPSDGSEDEERFRKDLKDVMRWMDTL